MRDPTGFVVLIACEKHQKTAEIPRSATNRSSQALGFVVLNHGAELGIEQFFSQGEPYYRESKDVYIRMEVAKELRTSATGGLAFTCTPLRNLDSPTLPRSRDAATVAGHHL
ncbi:hypothetical protein GGR58DRAFT_509400 [Xylaria digitata]|nr:hypothetical protein GGR58DRAFT_509400 [Xylaria digitata]